MVRARLIFPLVVFCALAAAAPALALPHLSKAQSRVVSNLVERWVNDVVRGRNLADGWKIAGPPERGGITRKAWLSGRQLPVLQMRVRNNPRTAWYATWRSGNELGLVVSLKRGRGKNREMIDNEMTLQKRNGQWDVYAFYADGIFRFGRGHSGSCVSSSCKVTGIADYMPGGPSRGGTGTSESRVGGSLRILVFAGFLGLPFIALLAVGLVFFVKGRQARRAQTAYLSSRAT